MNNYTAAFYLTMLGLLVLAFTTTKYYKRNYMAVTKSFINIFAFFIIVCAGMLSLITALNDIEKNSKSDKKEQCERVQLLHPDRDVILSDKCYVSVGSGLYEVYKGVDINLYLKDEVVKNGK